MPIDNLARESRRQKRLERFGTNEPLCGMCGEADDRCLERHHIAGRKHEDMTALICRNCHRKVSDDQRDHPIADTNADPALVAIGYFLIGLADMLRLIVERLAVYGRSLIECAAVKTEGGAA
jgi:hypothetical protein